MLKITKGQAMKTMLGLLTLVIIFHLAVVLQIIPYSIVWAGKLNTVDEMYAFEAVSISINIFLVTVLLLKGNYIPHRISEQIINAALWLFFALFVLNTIGNLLAETMFERLVFSPLTLLSSILIWVILSKQRR